MRKAAVLLGRSPLSRYSVHHGYLDGLVAVGLMPMMIPAGSGVDPSEAAALACEADVVLITGGDDIDPRCYGMGPGIGEREVDPERDAVEISVTKAAHAAGRAVLGICRGAQVIAVALGGTLVPDLPTAGFVGHWDHDNEHHPVHGIATEPGSAAAIATAGAQTVNSIHHQAVADPGPLLKASAWGTDGVIEAVETEGVLGVQWHPERLIATDRRHLAPFEWLVSA